MKHIILSMPAFYVYLLLVVALLLVALWDRESAPPAGKPRATALTTGRDVADTRVAAYCGLDQAPSWSSAWQRQRGRHPFHDLEAALAACYAAKWEQAIRTIRVGPRAGARSTEQVAG